MLKIKTAFNPKLSKRNDLMYENLQVFFGLPCTINPDNIPNTRALTASLHTRNPLLFFTKGS